ncbi:MULTISPECIES: serpin family protein [Clostridium]|uniref:serpin family protein n=1 Tax=Clostridium TaxID=1485 RepID=UPI000824AAE3|nr:MULTISPECIES: serpin family protein [Clostridium]
MKAKSKILIVFILICIGSISIAFFNKYRCGKAEVTPKTPKIQAERKINTDFAKSASDFSVEIFKRTALSKENVSSSPLSAYIALGLTLNGADGNTKEALESVLNEYKLNDDELNLNYKYLIGNLTQNMGNTKFNIANSLWYSKDFKIKKEFVQKNQLYFNAEAYGINFGNKDVAKKINDWVKNKTNNLIDKLIDKVEPDAKMYLINTVCFKGKWKDPFKTKNTFKDDFKDESGNTKVKFMKNSVFINFIKTEKEEAVELPYDDNRFDFIAVMPASNINLNDYINSFDENTIKNMLGNMTGGEVTVMLPKFTSEFQMSLNDVLKSMGLDNLFNKNEADFSKMYYRANDIDNNLYISDIQHKTFVKIDESGTEAAAATEIKPKETLCRPTKDNIEIKFNRPFVYMIIDTKTSIPVFMGVMRNPS